MSVLVATDLDRTMIYSQPAMGEAQFAALDTVCVEIYRDAPLSYMTTTAVQLLAHLADEVPVIPTTTRTPDQYERIALPGGPFRYAVASNGGRILVDGADDPAWRHQIERVVSASGAGLDEVLTELRTRIDDSWVKSLRIADDLFCYLVVEPAAQPHEFLPAWQDWCAAHGWTASQQGRKIYATPRSVTKSAAIAEVRRRLVDDGTIGTDAQLYAAGDGWLDADLLEIADHAIRPRHGELELLGWTTPGLTVTAETGALAGVEILEWLHARCSVRPASDPARPSARAVGTS
ncbi:MULTISPECIES: HAD family hydrolase [Gordonia]|uniref:HAD family hydrolase n=1 Tax=Gordonia TaxID=2053 RepID=UPI0012BB3520|nr:MULTISPECIES: HAD family hydrolase [Gordonia]MDH3020692.1 HAD family hydrolase [Gordonia alkanivorans]MDH3024828.1 HAD family hydrolase [Gordonia alkanivorans]MDH3049711.1 HAD family hydrolase [Gordonia alkanivorans]MDJ0008157.1 HAD family hydrolase [Gordonia alkanivorans]MDJ0097684.1 HAD family hydrolase [Gordonia alkanivorans]